MARELALLGLSDRLKHAVEVLAVLFVQELGEGHVLPPS
jgi:hypothetical protein